MLTFTSSYRAFGDLQASHRRWYSFLTVAWLSPQWVHSSSRLCRYSRTDTASAMETMSIPYQNFAMKCHATAITATAGST